MARFVPETNKVEAMFCVKAGSGASMIIARKRKLIKLLIN
jgi:hypothetical protein